MDKKHPHMDRILRVIDYIHGHADQDLSLDRLADIAAMSRFHWHRVFGGDGWLSGLRHSVRAIAQSVDASCSNRLASARYRPARWLFK